MEQHVKILGIIDIVAGIFWIVMGVLLIIVAILGAAAAGTSGAEDAEGIAAVIASIGLVVGVFLGGMGALQIIVGVKLRAYKSWARIVQIILGIMSLPSVPFGTAFGIYTLWAMFNQDTAVLFTSDD